MGRLWEDGFDHYGSDNANMLDNSYGTASSFVLTTAQFVTGTHSVLFNSPGGLNLFDGLRWVLPTAKTKLGVAMRLYFPSLPGQPYSAGVLHLLSSSSLRSQLSFFVDDNGAFRIVRGVRMDAQSATGTQGGTLLATTDPLISSSGWNHVEIQANIDDAAGWVRIAVNGIHRYELTGVDTAYDATGIVSVGQAKPFNNSSGDWYMDDYYIYDFTGDSAVDTDFCPPTDGTGKATGYIGELQVWPLFANGDTLEADWAKSSGTDGYALIDEPNPDDADYIYSTTAGDLSEFDLDDLPEEITYVRGLGIHARMSKSDAGAAMLQIGMKSVAATDDAAERPVTTEPTYWRDTIDVDPNSSARWTRDSLNAGKLRLTRSV